MCAKFQAKQIILNFSSQICPKMKLRLEIQKTNLGIRISNFEIVFVQFFKPNGQI